jgi:hypothetical protein
MATLEVAPRPTPAERHDAAVEVEVDEALTVHAATIEDWVTPRQPWELTLREGTDFDRPNNVEAVVLFVTAEQTSSLTFRLDQLDRVEDEGQELVLIFEERDGIAKAARMTANGLDVELFHILTFT